MPICSQCRYCDKESVLQQSGLFAGQWLLNGEGYCNADDSQVNGPHMFHQRIDGLNAPRECSQFAPVIKSE